MSGDTWYNYQQCERMKEETCERVNGRKQHFKQFFFTVGKYQEEMKEKIKMDWTEKKGERKQTWPVYLKSGWSFIKLSSALTSTSCSSIASSLIHFLSQADNKWLLPADLSPGHATCYMLMPAGRGEPIQLQVSSVGTFNELKQSANSVFIITLYHPKVGREESLCLLVPPGGQAHKDSLNRGLASRQNRVQNKCYRIYFSVEVCVVPRCVWRHDGK